jgi:gamma-glutamylcyclotransferase (GGCT)/AIG2-like uncharacterized protein YtfP
VIDPEGGEELYKAYIYGSSSGAFLIDAKCDASALKSGDVIRFTANNKNKITKLDKIFDYETGDRTGAADTPDGSKTFLYWVYDKAEPYIKATPSMPVDGIEPTEYYIYRAASFSVFLYDGASPADSKVKAASAADMVDFLRDPAACSRVFVNTRLEDPRTIIIFK